MTKFMTGFQPLVSVVIPFKDRIPLLLKTLESVKRQTYENIEIILVDDASRGNAEPQISSCLKGQAFRYFKNETSKGPGFCRHYGFERGRGEYLLYLDSDDILHPDMIGECVECLEKNPSFGMVYVVSKEFFNDAQLARPEELKIRKRSDRGIVTNILWEILKSGRIWDTSACLWRRRAVSSFDSFEPVWEDYAYDAQITTQAMRIISLPKPLCYYRNHHDNISHSDQKNWYYKKIFLVLQISNCVFLSRKISFHEKLRVYKFLLKQLIKLQLRFGQIWTDSPAVIRQFFFRMVATSPLFSRKLPLRILGKFL